MGRPSTAWTDPQVGDTCSRPANRQGAPGKSRVVQQVSYRSVSGRLYAARAADTWPDRVAYLQGGHLRTISASQWATWCRAAVREGGAYERGGVVYRFEGGAFVAGERV